MRCLEDLHSAELQLCSHQEELLKIRLDASLSPSPSQCDSGYAFSLSPSSSERLIPPAVSRCERLPDDPKSLDMKSGRQPPLRDSCNSYLPSHISDRDIDLCSISSRGYSTTCPSQTPMHTVTSAHPSNEGTRTLQDFTASSSHYHESDARFPAPASHPRSSARDSHVSCNANVVSPSTDRTPQCLRVEELEFIAKNIELFDPDHCDHNVDNYFRELEHQLIYLPHATQLEKVQLVWKTSSKAVRKFIQTQPPSVRDDYIELRQALIEEFSSTADEITAMVAALQIKHSRRESPKDYYNRLRHAYFQGNNAPGLEENPTFKSLFLKNLHPCVRTHVVLMTRQGNPSMHEVRKMTQMAWETVVSFKAKVIRTVPASPESPVSCRPPAARTHPHHRPKGGDRRQHRDTERNRPVHHLPRDRHSHNRSCRRPYSEMSAHNYDQPMDHSEDDRSISDQSSEHGYDYSDSGNASGCLSAPGYTERNRPAPPARRNFKHNSSRVRSSRHN